MTPATGFSLALASCIQPAGGMDGSKQPDSDRGVDTEATDTEDQPQDTGGPPTDTDLSECNDTNNPTTGPWQPGDPIPGWCDYPCEEELELPPDAVELDLTLGCALLKLRAEGEERTSWSGTFYYGRDWSERACQTPEGDWWVAGVDGTWQDSGPARADRGQGRVTDWPDGITAYMWESDGNWTYVDTLHDAVGEESYVEHRPGGICMSRVRPDHVKGWSWLDFTAHPLGPYTTIVYTRIDVKFEPHAGMYYPRDDSQAVEDAMTDAQSMFHYTYATEWAYDGESGPTLYYDEAWPWDEITDPDIRQQVYDMYTPME